MLKQLNGWITQQTTGNKCIFSFWVNPFLYLKSLWIQQQIRLKELWYCCRGWYSDYCLLLCWLYWNNWFCIALSVAAARTLPWRQCRCCGWTSSWILLHLWPWQQNLPRSLCWGGSRTVAISLSSPAPWQRTFLDMESISSSSSSRSFLLVWTKMCVSITLWVLHDKIALIFSVLPYCRWADLWHWQWSWCSSPLSSIWTLHHHLQHLRHDAAL